MVTFLFIFENQTSVMALNQHLTDK